jgi:predicted nucleic acid-binding protein
LRAFIAANNPAVSAVSVVEVLGYHKLTAPDKQHFEEFFAAAQVLSVSDAVVRRAVGLRQQRKMTLGDALIAATSLEYGRALVTRNLSDFQWVAGLTVLDAFNLPTS